MAQDPQNGQNDRVNGDGDVPTAKMEKSDEYLLDMVFVLDCTGSMASYINSARDNIVKISQELSKLSEKHDNNKKTDKNKTEPKRDAKSNDNPTDAPKDDVKENQIEGQVDTSDVGNDVNSAATPDSDVAPGAVASVAESQDNNESKENDSKTESKTDDKNKEERVNPEPKKKLSCKFAVVAYRDHPPQDSTFITQIRDFTSSSVMIKNYLSTLQATGGGDGPESLTCALYDVLNNLKYRENSQKIIIVITDAPPHGLEDPKHTIDHFPNGDPWPKWKLEKIKPKNNRDKNKYLSVKTRESTSGEYDKKDKQEMPDILEIARNITDDLQASFYTVACEPCLSTSYDYARDLMEAIAEMSNGKYLPLASANLLPKVIIGSVKQQMLIDELTEEIDKEIDELKLQYKNENKENELTEDIIAEFMEKKWENANITYKEVAIGTLYRKERKRDNIEFLLNRQECKTLKDFAKKRIKLERLKHSDFRHLNTSSSSSSRSGVDIAELDATKSYMSSSIASVLERGERLESLVARSSDLSDTSKMFYKKSKKSNSFSLGGSFSSFFGGSGGSSGTTSMTTSMAPAAPAVSDAFDDTIDSSMDEAAAAPRMPSSGLVSDKKRRGRRGKKKKGKSGSSDDMVLSTRWADDDSGNRSCSEDEQEVYEEVRTMDSKGVRKAVSRYMQTYY